MAVIPRLSVSKTLVVLLFSLLLSCSLRGPRFRSHCTEARYRGYDIVAVLSASSDVSLLEVEALEKVVAASDGTVRVLGLVLERSEALYLGWLSSTQPVFEVRRVDSVTMCSRRIAAEPVLFLLDANGRVYKVLTGYSSPSRIMRFLRK